MERIKTMVVDDHIPFRWGLIESLSREDTLEIVEEDSDGIEAVEKARNTKPNVVLMDLNMPVSNGIEVAGRLNSEMPEIKILILSVSDSGDDLMNALKAGAHGFILKNESPRQIAQAINYVAHGGIIVSPSMGSKLLDKFAPQQPPINDVFSCPFEDHNADAKSSQNGIRGVEFSSTR